MECNTETYNVVLTGFACDVSECGLRSPYPAFLFLLEKYGAFCHSGPNGTSHDTTSATALIASALPPSHNES